MSAEPHGDTRAVEQDLAIIVPAYKAAFLDETLQSILSQSDRRFVLYVFDDASPHDLAAIMDKYTSQQNVRYHRFAENLGQRSLAAHWDRCVRLTREPWIWLFSDDDRMEQDCVAAFHAAVADTQGRYPLYHFNVQIIDEGGIACATPTRFQRVLPVDDFVRARLRYALESFAVEYIVSRQAYEQGGGFTEFPAAWASDDASWISFAADQGIFSIDGPRIHWRRSGQNITNLASPFKPAKFAAAVEFVEWLARRYGARWSPPDAAGSSLRALAREWFQVQLIQLHPRLGLLTAWRYARRAHRALGGRSVMWLWKMLRSAQR